ncbi:MAG: translation initiation factor IF-2 [Thermoplasmata archaeon]|nr:translation initiation factor IF-2 [Thermoplasmata archaeon]
MAEMRQPILSLLGHVDHGKTTLLDRIAGSVKAAHEAGGITQHIGAIEVPSATIVKLCQGILDTTRFQVPGLLVIDTPGHRSFETMRKRGGALADIAILVIDARDGVMPQTRESIQILRHEKTPFAVALTKIDLLSGWKKPTGPVTLAAQIERCGPDYSRLLDQRLYSASEQLAALGFSCERYDRVSDFTRNVGLVPVSARHSVGIAELLALLVGLSQRFLGEQLAVATEGGEATVLERSDQRGIGPVSNVIVYRGRLAVGDEIVATGREAPFVTKVRGIYRPHPVVRGRTGRGQLDSLDHVVAAAGVYVSATGIEGAMPGGHLKVVHGPEEVEAVKAELAREAQPVNELAESGIAIFADTLGGLEALAFECREASLPVHETGVGPVGRPTILRMATVKDPTHRAVLAFSVPVLSDAQPEGAASPVRVFRGDIMYRIIEEYQAWRTQKTHELTARRRLETVHPAKLTVLPGFVFRSSKPAIVGIKVLAGTLRPGVRLMKSNGVEVGVLKALQKDGDSVAQAEELTELAASIDGAVVGRTLSEGDVLYVSVPEAAARLFKDQPLTATERTVLDEIVKIRRAQEPFWGQ